MYRTYKTTDYCKRKWTHKATIEKTVAINSTFETSHYLK